MKANIKHNDKIDNSELAHLFNNHDINTAESISGIPPESIGNLK